MNHCLICGQRDCQVCAYTEDAADDCPACRTIPINGECDCTRYARGKHVPSPAYREWLMEIELRKDGGRIAA